MAVYKPHQINLSDEELAVVNASGFGASQGLGRRPALLVIDVNYKFVGDPQHQILEAIQEWPTSCGPRGWEAIPAVQRLLHSFRQSGQPVFFTTGDDRSEALAHGRWAGKNHRVEGLESNETEGNRILQAVAPIAGDVVLRKTKPSAFSGTPLLSYLVELGIDTLVLAGCTTSGCVRATAVDGFSFNYRIAVASDGVFDRLDTSHEVSLFDLSLKYADVLSADECLQQLNLCPAADDQA